MESGQRYVGFAHSRLCAVPSPFLCGAGKSMALYQSCIHSLFCVYLLLRPDLTKLPVLSFHLDPGAAASQSARVAGVLAIASPISFELKRNLVNILDTCVFLFSAE